MTDPYALATEAATALTARFGVDRVDHAYVLGSGWAAAADDLGELIGSCPLADLPGFSAPVVEGHGGQLRLVRTATGATSAVLTGRTHLYEGRGTDAVVHGVRTVAAAGASTVILTNGCGGLRPEWPAGTPVLIRDHLNLTGQTPLVGPRFVDLTDAYSARLRRVVKQVSSGIGEGVYAQFPGPQYETPAEVQMAKTLGADLVGMSTAVETIAAREAGLEVLAISLVTNAAAGISPHPLSHEEVVQAGRTAAPVLHSLLAGIAGVL